MTAADTWPDGTPKRTTNVAAWNGEKPLVEPVSPAPISVGDLVSLRVPVDQKGDPIVRGVVLAVDPTPDGEIVVTIARELRKPPDGRYTEIRWEFRYEQHPAEAVDPAWHVPVTHFRRDKTNAAAARIALAVGLRHLGGGDWDREDRLLLGGALVLSDLHHQRHQP